MNKIKMASPLYILREACARDLMGVLERLAELGFDGVEFLGFFGHSAQAVRARMDALGMQALGNHVPYRELTAGPEAVLDFHKEVGCEYLTVAELPEGDLMPVAETLAPIARMAGERGIRLLFHNHARELYPEADGSRMLDRLMAAVPAEVMALEPDLGWMEIGGADPADYLLRYWDRCPVIHLKDYYAKGGPLTGIQGDIPERGDESRGCFEFRPVGYGILNVPKLMPLCLACDPKWMVMDHDLAYDRDSYEDLKVSLDYTRALLGVL